LSRAAWGAGILALFLTSMHMTLLGALLACVAVTLIVLLYAHFQIQTCVEYTTESIQMYYACGTRVPLIWLRHVRNTAILLLPIFVLLAHDAYIARHNSHRAITTRAYQWFVRVQAERPRRENGGHA
jgi:hypothetical protein